MVPATTHLIGFSGETIWPLGQIALLVKIGNEVHSTSAWMNFMVIRSPSQHNAIIGRPGIRKIRAVPSTAHGMLKFPVEGGTVTLQSSRVIPMECAMISGPSIQTPASNQVLEEKINIAIHPEYPEQTVAIGSTLTEKGRKELLPTLTAPREREELIIYLAAAKEAISAVLMTDREGRQIPVYFVANYGGRISEISGRMLKWKFELEGYDIQYRPRTAIKGQILADFIVERPEEESPDKLMAEPEVLPKPWTLFTDGSSCVDAPGQVLVGRIEGKVINKEEILDIVEVEGNTMDDTHYKYLAKRNLPEDNRRPERYYWTTPMHMDAGTLIGNAMTVNTLVPSKKSAAELDPNHACQHFATEIDQAKNNEALGINLDLIEERREQAAIQEAKEEIVENITTQESAEQVSSRVIWSTAAMKQVMLRTKANLDPSGRDHTKLKND
ncbi:hypothetical protein Tco_0954821 [Tanacetum coccineum]|uniref:Reverse transcriptase domain-containing protein n=1 Tax=Tanacetum coccineum TaxID=301880 RepID=A0ABQ5E5H4_9ASTR